MAACSIVLCNFLNINFVTTDNYDFPMATISTKFVEVTTTASAKKMYIIIIMHRSNIAHLAVQ